MSCDRTILIAGVTGNEGGAVARALEGAGFHLRGLTRMPEGGRAAALARQGVEVVKGDLDNEATLRRALAGAWGVFGVQNTLEAGVEREQAQRKRLARLAREADIKHFVYTSLGSAHKRTGIPHFDNKWRIEETSPFALLARFEGDKVAYVQFLEDTYGTAGSFKTGGATQFHSDPSGQEVVI